MKISADSPLTKIAEDRFRRGSLVDMIVKSIQSVSSKAHPCVVYGLYGKWGEGKTSILNFIEEQLRLAGKEDKIIITHFNPWLVEGEEALLREFFKTIIKDADDKVRELNLRTRDQVIAKPVGAELCYLSSCVVCFEAALWSDGWTC